MSRYLFPDRLLHSQAICTGIPGHQAAPDFCACIQTRDRPFYPQTTAIGRLSVFRKFFQESDTARVGQGEDPDKLTDLNHMPLSEFFIFS